MYFLFALVLFGFGLSKLRKERRGSDRSLRDDDR